MYRQFNKIKTSMKSKISKTSKNSSKITSYPAIGRCGRAVVLFYRKGAGMVIHPNEIYNVGELSEDWDMSLFELLPETEKIELSN